MSMGYIVYNSSPISGTGLHEIISRVENDTDFIPDPTVEVYIDDVLTEIPVSYLEVTDDIFRKSMEEWNDWLVEPSSGGLVRKPPVPEEVILNNLKIIALNKLSIKTKATIEAGFQSNALGSVHTYPSSTQDQSNLTASVVASMIPGIPSDWTTAFWCMDEAGTWKYELHNISQIQQVGIDCKNFITAQLTLAAYERVKIESATSVVDLSL